MAIVTDRIFILLNLFFAVNGYSLPFLGENLAQSSQLINLIRKSQEKLALNYRQNSIDDDLQPGFNGFSWSSCGRVDDPSNLTSLSLSPDPLQLPGNITLAFDGTLQVDLTAPVKLELTLKKKVLFWIEIPCVDNIGSCTYDDVCSMLAKFKCPPIFTKYGIPCKCPVKSGRYTLPNSNVYVDPEGIPSFLEKGEYQAQATLSMAGKQIACIKMELSVA